MEPNDNGAVTMETADTTIDAKWHDYLDKERGLFLRLISGWGRRRYALGLVKRGLTLPFEDKMRNDNGSFTLEHDGVVNVQWIGEDESVRHAVYRIMNAGVDRFFTFNPHFFFYPSAKKMAKYLYDYAFMMMPVVPPKGRETPSVLYSLTKERNDLIEEYVCDVHKAYKDKVPLFYSGIFPEWAVRWVYDEKREIGLI